MLRQTKLALVFGAVSLATLLVGCGGDDSDDASPTATTAAEDPTATPAEAGDEMSLASSAFAGNETIPVQYTCDGDNISPPLTIAGVPEDAVSLALLVDDPDAPGGSFVHWTVWNIDPATTEFPEGSAPAGSTEGANGAGQGYTGPCPPSGEHRYIFTLFALDSVPDLQAAAGKTELLEAIEGKVIAEAELIGLYSRAA